MKGLSLKERLAFGLDVPASQAQEQIDLMGGVVGWVKTNSVFVGGGPGLIRAINKTGTKIFFDLKWFDIPNTASNYVSEALIALEGVGMFNIHASSGSKMMKSALKMAEEIAIRSETKRPLVIAVTVLTSMNEDDLKEVGINSSVKDQVLRLTYLTLNSGLDGVVASALEAPMLRKEFGNDFIIATPGIRFEEEAKNDQERVATPRSAIAGGSDILVMARSLLKGGVLAVKRAYAEIEAGLDDRQKG